MATCSFKLAYLFSVTSLICFTHLLLLSLVIQADTDIGFSVDLIHRDSPLSPFYNPSETYIDRLHNAYLRSISRINHFKTTLSASTRAFQSPMVNSGGEYYMEISIGNPNIKVLGIADTGSDLTWIQCMPCKKCYKQKPQIYNPQNSSTFKLLPCKSPYCNDLKEDKRCDVKRNVCGYKYSYADGSFTKGDIGSETLTFPSGNPVSFSNIIFGCGHDNGGVFDEMGSGIIGIGGGPLSLIAQLDLSMKGKFSYCLVPTPSNVSSKIKFGTGSLVSGHGVFSTPLVSKKPATFYFVTLEAISVGKNRLVYTNNSSTTVQKGNMIIDSGTTYTSLDPQFYEKLTEALEKAIGSKRVEGQTGMPSVCFRVPSHQSDLPIITFHFAGADVKVPPLSSYIRVQKDMVCLTMTGQDDLAVLGNLSQRNVHVGYDLEKKVVSFMPTDCTKYA